MWYELSKKTEGESKRIWELTINELPHDTHAHLDFSIRNLITNRMLTDLTVTYLSFFKTEDATTHDTNKFTVKINTRKRNISGTIEYIEDSHILIDSMHSLPFTIIATHDSSINKLTFNYHYDGEIRNTWELELDHIIPENHELYLFIIKYNSPYNEDESSSDD